MTAIAVYHEVTGRPDAPALVFANSLGTTLAMWDPQLPALAERLRVVRYDHRGHGGSPVPPGPYTIADLGADALALLDRLGLERVAFCGLSLGGMVGMWLAAHAPERVECLVLCCTSARLGPPATWAQRAATVRAQGTAAIVDTGTARWFTPGFRARAPETVARYAAMLASVPDEGYAACCGVIEHMDLRPELASVRARTLVIAGADDPATPPEHAEAIVDGIRGGGTDARLVVLPDAAHLANVEQADAVNRLVLDHVTPERTRP